MDWNIEEIVASSDQLPSQTDIDTKPASLKLKVLSALIDNSYLNPLHEKLATKAGLLLEFLIFSSPIRRNTF